MYNFERKTLEFGWNKGFIRNVGDYTNPDYSLSMLDAFSLLRQAYADWASEPSEAVRHEYINECLVGENADKLMANAAGVSLYTLRDAWAERLVDLVDRDQSVFGLLCDLENIDRVSAKVDAAIDELREIGK